MIFNNDGLRQRVFSEHTYWYHLYVQERDNVKRWINHEKWATATKIIEA